MANESLQNDDWNDFDEVLCRSSYTERLYLSQEAKSILLFLMTSITLLGVLANSSVVYGLVASRQLNNLSTRLILYLTISDWCLTVIGLPLYILLLTNYFGKNACALVSSVEFLLVLFAHVSAYIIGIIGYDRYFRIHYLNRYSEIVKVWKLRLAVITSIMFSLIHTTAQVVGIHYSFYEKVASIGIVIDLFLVVFILFPYILSIRTMKEHRNHASNRELLRNVDKVVTVSATRIMIAVIVLYTPYIVFSIIRRFESPNSKLITSKWFSFGLFFSYFLALSNSFVNSIILLNINSKCRRKLFKLMRSMGLTIRHCLFAKSKPEVVDDNTVELDNII